MKEPLCGYQLLNINQPNDTSSTKILAGFDEKTVLNALNFNNCIKITSVIANVVNQGKQIGVFSNGINGSNLSIDHGLVLTTGIVEDAFSVNSEDYTSKGLHDSGIISDQEVNSIDLNSLGTFDEAIVIVEFTVPHGIDGIRIPFQFSSDEYPEFLESKYNDAFGILISRKGHDDFKNIALVPGTDKRVSINSINSGLTDERGTSTKNQNYRYFIDNSGDSSPIKSEYDGFTTLIYAQAHDLIPEETYLLKIAIADIGGAAFDSGVFIGSIEGISDGNSIKDCAKSQDHNNSSTLDSLIAEDESFYTKTIMIMLFILLRQSSLTKAITNGLRLMREIALQVMMEFRWRWRWMRCGSSPSSCLPNMYALIHGDFDEDSIANGDEDVKRNGVYDEGTVADAEIVIQMEMGLSKGLADSIDTCSEPLHSDWLAQAAIDCDSDVVTINDRDIDDMDACVPNPLAGSDGACDGDVSDKEAYDEGSEVDAKDRDGDGIEKEMRR